MNAVLENASHITIYQYLEICDWNIEGLKKVVTQNPSSINEVTHHRGWSSTPLMKVLRSKKCTVDIIKLLLHHGADINLQDSSGDSPLISALKHCRDDKLIELLLDNGARADNGRLFSPSPFCVALHRYPSKCVLKLLLDAGFSLACRLHGPIIYCSCSALRFGIREDILQWLIEVGAEVSKLDDEGHSPMCVALYFGAGPKDIELLMRVGVSLNACKCHSSPFHCLVANRGSFFRILKADVVKTLLDSGARLSLVVEDRGTILQDILRRCEYETEAFKLLLDVPGVDVNDGDQIGDTLLHCAVKNPFCQLGTVKHLLHKGAKVDKVNAQGETVLDVAILRRRSLDVIKLLLQKGSPINTQDHNASKSLMLTFVASQYRNGINPNLVMTLLIAGARIGKTQSIKQPLSAWIRRKQKYNRNPLVHQYLASEELDCIKYLVKCYGLEYSKFEIKNLIQDHRLLFELHFFVEECKLELHRMESKKVGHGRTLHQLISRKSPPRTIAAGCTTEGKDFGFSQLLETLSCNAFPLYFDIISANVGKESMEKKLQELPVYTVRDCPDLPRTDTIVTLNYDIVRVIAGYLSDVELLTMILAFYYPKNHASSKRGSEEQNVVGPGQSNFHKRPKLS